MQEYGNSTLEKKRYIDESCLFKENKGCSAQSDFAQVALEYFQTPHQQDDISGKYYMLRLLQAKRKANLAFSPTILGLVTVTVSLPEEICK